MKEIDNILYLNECPVKKLKGRLDGICLTSWGKTKSFIEKTDIFCKKESPFITDLNCFCYIEYGDSRFPHDFGAEGGYIIYSPNGERCKCKIKIDGDLNLFYILRKFFESRGMLIDSVSEKGHA